MTFWALQQFSLVSKDRFFQEVWGGIAVTDEALTQCIKTLRSRLGDSAANPQFIETVPKHGYRFIAPVQWLGDATSRVEAVKPSWRQFFLLGGAGTLGGIVAGLIGGLFFGFMGASPQQADMGAISVILVLVCLTIFIALLGAAGVAFGIAATGFARACTWWARILGGAVGGLLVGALVKLIGSDAFQLLFGRSPGDITGSAEGALLGGAVGLGMWLASRRAPSESLGRSIVPAAIAGGLAGFVIPLLGGRMMGGSLDLLTAAFPDSRLRIDHIGRLFGESGFGPISQAITGGAEGALFVACVVGAMVWAQRSSQSA